MKSRLRRFTGWHEAILGLLLLGLLLAAYRVDPTFLSRDAQIELSTHVWELALLALPMTLIIITSGIDLSVGATMALAAVILGMLYKAGVNPWIGAAAALAAGTAAGFLNGVFIAWVRVHPLIVTLATLSAFRGIAEGISLGKPVSGFPEGFQQLGQGSVAGLPIPGLIFCALAVPAAILLARSTPGRWLYAMGHNETASRFSGIPVDRVKLALYTLSGSAAALAAMMFVARRNTAKADAGTGMELDVITAVVLGGTSIFGGRGRILGTLLGVLLIHETREFVSWRWNRDELNFIVLGVLLILSVSLNALLAPKGKEE